KSEGVVVKLLDYPARAWFRCDCGTTLNFSTFDRPGERMEIPCPTCGRLWEQRLVVEAGERGWNRTLVGGDAPPDSGTEGRTPAPSKSKGKPPTAARAQRRPES